LATAAAAPSPVDAAGVALVFVFAVTQLSLHLLEHLTVEGAGQTMFLLLVVWWAWIYTTWMTNWFDPTRCRCERCCSWDAREPGDGDRRAAGVRGVRPGLRRGLRGATRRAQLVHRRHDQARVPAARRVSQDFAWSAWTGEIWIGAPCWTARGARSHGCGAGAPTRCSSSPRRFIRASLEAGGVDATSTNEDTG
jgi:Bacterial low temperature requirement A protein (LtrA)